MKERWIAPPTPPLRSVERIMWADHDSIVADDPNAAAVADLLMLDADAATDRAALCKGAARLLADLSQQTTRRAIDHMGVGADEAIDLDLVRLARDLRINAAVLGCLWHLYGKHHSTGTASIETSIDWSAVDAERSTPANLAQEIGTMFDDMARHRAVRHLSTMRLENSTMQWCGTKMPAVHAFFDLTHLSLSWDGIVLYLSGDRISDTLLARHHGRSIKDIVPHPLLPDDARLIDHREKRGVQALITDRTPMIGTWRDAARMHPPR